MTGFLINYFIFYSFLFIATEKLKLQDIMNNSKCRLLYKISLCDFCFCFWIACFTTAVTQLFIGYDLQDLLFPFAITGFWLIFKELRHD